MSLLRRSRNASSWLKQTHRPVGNLMLGGTLLLSAAIYKFDGVKMVPSALENHWAYAANPDKWKKDTTKSCAINIALSPYKMGAYKPVPKPDKISYDKDKSTFSIEWHKKTFSVPHSAASACMEYKKPGGPMDEKTTKLLAAAPLGGLAFIYAMSLSSVQRRRSRAKEYLKSRNQLHLK